MNLKLSQKSNFFKIKKMLSSRCIVLIRHGESQQEKLILISRRSLEKVVLAAMNAKSAELI